MYRGTLNELETNFIQFISWTFYPLCIMWICNIKILIHHEEPQPCRVMTYFRWRCDESAALVLLVWPISWEGRVTWDMGRIWWHYYHSFATIHYTHELLYALLSLSYTIYNIVTLNTYLDLTQTSKKFYFRLALAVTRIISMGPLSLMMWLRRERNRDPKNKDKIECRYFIFWLGANN